MKTVHLVPTGLAFIPGVPAVECDVTRAEANALLAYSPPAFTIQPRAAVEDPPEDIIQPPPEEPAVEVAEDPPEGGPSDSRPE